jgi:hypothetical protein
VLLDQVLNGQSFGAQTRLNTSLDYQDVQTGPYPPQFQSLFHTLFPYEQELYEAGVACYRRTIAGLRNQAHSSPGKPPVSETAPRAMYTVDWEGPTRGGGFSDRVVAASFGYAGRYARRVEAAKAILEFDVPRVCDARVEAVFWIGPFDTRFDCRLSLNGVPLKLFDTPWEVGCPADPSQTWAYASVSAATLGRGRCRLEIDRSAASRTREFWLLDLAIRPVAQPR